MYKFRYLKNVTTLKLDTEKCTGCGQCELVCPHKVFQIESGKAKIADIDACMECGACKINCRFGAITVRSGVGCASGIISAALGLDSACCCCEEQIHDE